MYSNTSRDLAGQIRPRSEQQRLSALCKQARVELPQEGHEWGKRERWFTNRNYDDDVHFDILLNHIYFSFEFMGLPDTILYPQ